MSPAYYVPPPLFPSPTHRGWIQISSLEYDPIDRDTLIINQSNKQSAPSFPEFLGPILEFLQTLFAHAGANVDQARLEICELDGPDLVHGHVQQSFAQAAERAHRRVFC